MIVDRVPTPRVAEFVTPHILDQLSRNIFLYLPVPSEVVPAIVGGDSPISVHLVVLLEMLFPGIVDSVTTVNLPVCSLTEEQPRFVHSRSDS